MINRKIASLALIAAVSAPSAFAGEVIFSDGRPGGAFWGQPVASTTIANGSPHQASLMSDKLIFSDGRPGGAFWGSKVAVEGLSVPTAERFVPTSQVRSVRSFSFLEDYNP